MGTLKALINKVCSKEVISYIIFGILTTLANTFKEKSIEFGKFILGRAFTMVIEIIGVFVLNDIIHSFYGIFSDNMAYLINKVLITIIVIILNFFISKFFAFKNLSK